MVRISPELIENASQYTNAINDRELDLRGYKFSIIENLGSCLDQYDTIDLTENEIRKLDGFPLLKRLRNLILVNNKVVRITEDLGQQLPNLSTLILSGNCLSDLRDLDPLSSCEKLDFLSLLHCPVTLRANYRLYVISQISSLRYLDYRRVTQAERKLARSMFKRLSTLPVHPTATKQKPAVGSTGAHDSISTTVKTFVPGAPLNSSVNIVPPGTEPVLSDQTDADDTSGESESGAKFASAMPPPVNPVSVGAKRPHGGSTQDLYAIQEAIKRARTIDEVERLHQLLNTGQIAGFAAQWQKQLRQQQQNN